MIDAGATLAHVRHLLGAAFAAAEPDPTLGDIRLRPEQRVATSRVLELMDRHGGAMLADTVGAGKTYVALAVARGYERTTIAAPAALRAIWTDAMQRAGVRGAFVSYERLSRDGRAAPAGDLVILDEAHHLRRSNTRRYAAATELCRGSRVLLVSATPLQNCLGELATQLALFLGARAHSLTDCELSAYIVRSAAEGVRDVPRLSGPHAVTLPGDDDCLELLVSLPPPIPVLDEGDGGALLLYSLLQQWSSSRAALIAALRRREARAAALSAILESGHMPSRAELAAWTCADNTIQLAFAELMVAEQIEPSALLGAVRAHENALRVAIGTLTNDRRDPDLARAEALRAIRRQHRGAQIVVFSQFAETVNALFRQLVVDGAVACLSARGVRIAGGSMSREEVLRQFLPDTPPAPAGSRVELLLTTDVLSEGLNLQRASVVVHLDLPWNPARLEQRVGRVRRLGSSHEVISVYAFSPPASAERLLRLRSRLEEKLRVANRMLGAALPLLPESTAAQDASLGTAGEIGAVAAILRRWRSRDPSQSAAIESSIAAVAAPMTGFVALLYAPGEPPLLVASLDGCSPTSASQIVRCALELCDTGAAARPQSDTLTAATSTLDDWWAAHRAAGASGLTDSHTTRSRRPALARVHKLLARAPRHARGRMAALAGEARRVLSAPLPRAEENTLAELEASPLDDEAWLEAIIAVGANRTAIAAPFGIMPAETPLRAIILLQDRVTGPAPEE